VALDGALGQDEGVGDFAVGQATRDEDEHLASAALRCHHLRVTERIESLVRR
jgi:hypothetical protein